MKKILLLLFLVLLIFLVQHQVFAQGSCPSVRLGSVTLTSLSNNGDGTCNFRLSFCFTNPTNGAKSIAARIYCGTSCVSAPTPTFSFCTDASGQAGVERCASYDFTCSCMASIQVIFDSRTGSSSCGGSTCGSTGCISFGVLSVKLNDASIETSDNQSCISWTVAEQSGIEKYELQGSHDGTTFIKIGEQPPVNGTGAFSYRFCRSNNFEFYRIKVLELNGRSFYSRVLRAGDVQKNIRLYPNPAADKIFIENYAAFRNNVYQVSSCDGRVLKTGSIRSNMLDIGSLPAGTYLLLIKEQNGQTLKQLFVKG